MDAKPADEMQLRQQAQDILINNMPVFEGALRDIMTNAAAQDILLQTHPQALDRCSFSPSHQSLLPRQVPGQ